MQEVEKLSVAPGGPEMITLHVLFDETELTSRVIEMASTFTGQVSPDGVILTIAQTTPPLVLGSSEEQRAQLKQVTSVKAKVLGRYCLTRERVQDLIRILQTNLKFLEQVDQENKK